jgi:hypothetical protein
MNKKSQFYIIAAIIIVIVVAGMAGISNYVIVREEPQQFYDLGENLGLEGAWVIDYGIYNEETITEVVDDFVKDYAIYIAQTGEDFELYVAYGDSDTGRVKKFFPEQGESGEVTIGDYGVESGITVKEEDLGEISTTEQFIIEETVYDIDVKEEQNFLFVITTSKGHERHVYEKTE